MLPTINIMHVVDDDAYVACHRHCALKIYFLILIGTNIFMEKSVTYVDGVYLK